MPMNCRWLASTCDGQVSDGEGGEDGPPVTDGPEVKPPKRTSFMRRGVGGTIIGPRRRAIPQPHTRSSRNSMISAFNSASSVWT